ncbi:MAG: hypothetical protein ACL7AX_01105 [Candidatus Arsenophonus phytopathogenicus]
MPLLIGSSITFGLAVADAGCAYANWHSQAKGGEGLKLGSDTIANAVYRLLNKAGMSSDSAENWSKYTSAFLRSGLVVGTLCSGGAVTTATLGALSSTFSATKLVSNVSMHLPQGRRLWLWTMRLRKKSDTGTTNAAAKD